MVIYQVQAPDGNIYDIEGPEGANEAQILGAAQKYIRQQRREDYRRRMAELERPVAVEEEPETTIGGQIGEAFKGLAPGAIGLAESAALGASALLDDETELAARKKIKEIAGIARKPFEAAPGYEDTVGRKFGEALGSTAPFFALGPLGIAGRVGAGSLGAAAGAGEARERAFEAGATAEQRGIATGLGTAVGVTEILPVFAFINNLGKPLTDGIMSRVRRAAATGGAEGLQEAAAQAAQNLIEKGVYNPEAGVFTGTGEALGYGAGVGAFIQAITDMALGRRAKRGSTSEEPTTTEPTGPEGPPLLGYEAEPFTPVALPDGSVITSRADFDAYTSQRDQVTRERAQDLRTSDPLAGLSEFDRDLARRGKQAALEETFDTAEPDLFGEFTAPREAPTETEAEPVSRDTQTRDMIDELETADIESLLAETGTQDVEVAKLKFESDMAELAGRIESRQEKTTQEKRLAVLLPIVEAVEPVNIPKTFIKELKAQGFPSLTLTDRERNLINRVYDIRLMKEVEPEVEVEPSAPAELEGIESLVPEKKTDRVPEQLGIPGLGQRRAPVVEEVAPVEAEFATVLTPKVLDKTGLPRQSGFYRQLLNKDMADPGQQQLIADVFARVRANPNTTNATKEAIELVAMQAFGGLASQQEMFGPRGGIRATPRKPKQGEQPRSTEPTGVGTGVEGDMGTSEEGRPQKVKRTGEPAAPKDAGLAGTQERTATDKPREKVPPTTVDKEAELTPEQEETIIKEFEDAMAEEMAAPPKQDKKVDKEPKPKAAPAKETKKPDVDKDVKDVEKNLTPAQKQAIDNYLGVTNNNFDNALEYLAGDLYYGSAKFFNPKENTYKQISFGTAGELVPGTGGKFGKAFYDALSDTDKKKVMDKVAKLRADEGRGQSIIKLNELNAAIKEQFDGESLDITYTALISGPVHPAVRDALKAKDLKKSLQILGEKLKGTLGKAATNLANNIGNTKVEVVVNLKNKSGKLVPGFYDPKTDTIKLDSELGLSPHVLLHEATHAATSHVLANKSHPITKQLNQLYQDVKDSLDTTYGATNLDEFVAEAFSNSQFQGKLNSLNPDGSKFSAWQRFVNTITNFVRRIMGLGTKSIESAQDQAEQLINSILSPAPDSRDAGSLYALSTAPGVRKVMDNLGNIQKTIYEKSPGIEEFAFSVEEFLTGTIPNTFKRVFLQFLPADVLVDLGQQVNKLKVSGGADLIRLFKEQRAKLGIENDKINATYEYLAKWVKNNPEKMNTLNQIWPKATLGVEIADGKRLGVDPDRPRKDYDGNKDQQALWDNMQPDWKSLGTEGQNAYRQVRDSYAKLFDRILDVIGGTVNVYVDDKQVQKEFRNEILTRLTEMTGRVDPYFPLFRQGDYWLGFSIANTSKSDRGEYVVKAFETAGARRKFIGELRGNKDVVQDSIDELERPEKLNVDRIPPTSFIGQTFRILSANKVPPDVQKEMMRLVIDLMPESSFVKSLQARKGTLGFAEDLLYTFKNRAPQLIQQTVRLEYGAKIRLVEEKIREVETKGNPNLKYLKDELLARGEFARSPPKDAVAETANRLAFLYTIGGNVSSAITQISSMATIIYPYLGGKYNYTDAGAAIKDATTIFINSGFNRRIAMTAPNGKQVSVDAQAAPAIDNYYEIDSKNNFKVRDGLKLSPKLMKEVEELLPLVETLTENGQLHRSLLADTIGLKDAYKDKTPWERMNAIAAFLFHQSDQFNRQITAVAAYKLELARLNKENPGMSLVERRKTAAEISLYETQLTNGGTVLETAPRIAQQGVGRVAMMYKSYGIAINYLLLRTARSAVNNLFADNKKDRDIAFKQLVGVFGSTVFLAGVQGLPLFGIYTMIANLFYDDDEDDAETRVRKAIKEGWYKGALAEYGGIDISERIGLTNLIFQANRFSKDPSFEEQVAYVLGGPALSVATRFGRGVKDLAEGDVIRGVEGMVPTALTNLIKGTFRYPSEGGIMTRRGDPIYDDISTGELMAQSLGFAPSAYTFRQEQNAAVKGIDIATNKLRSKLHKQYYLAVRMSDYSEMQDIMKEIRKFNRKHPTYVITFDSIRKSMAKHMDTSAKMHNGISISTGMRNEIQQHLNEYDQGFKLYEEEEEEEYE